MIKIDEQFWKEWCGLQVAKAFVRLESDDALLAVAKQKKGLLRRIEKELKR